jgi:hypothetical protein
VGQSRVIDPKSLVSSELRRYEVSLAGFISHHTGDVQIVSPHSLATAALASERHEVSF